MITVDLKFTELFPVSHFIRKQIDDKNGKQRFVPSDKVPDNSDRPGVYIWGFMIKGKFIPYYTGKSESSIAKRIDSHVIHLLKHDSTYARLSKDYMEGENPFFSDDHFYVQTSNWPKNKLPKWFREKQDHFRGKINYINNLGFFKDILKQEVVPKNPNRPEYPMSNIPGLDDYITDNIGNIFVTFADCSATNIGNLQRNDFYEILEAYVKFSLKGKTVSKSLSIDKMQKLKENKFEINLEIGDLDMFKDKPSKDYFPGY